MALNPWHGLGVVESWEARLLWLARLLCCKVGLLTRAHVPDRCVWVLARPGIGRGCHVERWRGP